MATDIWHDARLEDAFAYADLLSDAVRFVARSEEFNRLDRDPKARAERLSCVNSERTLGRNHGAIGTVRMSDELCELAVKRADEMGSRLDPPLTSETVFAISVMDHAGLTELRSRGPRNDDINSKGACDVEGFVGSDEVRRFLGNYATLCPEAVDMYLMRSSARADARNRFREAGVEQAFDDVYLYGNIAPNVHLVIGGNAFADSSGTFVTDDASGAGLSLYLTPFAESGYRPTVEVPIDEDGHMLGAMFCAGEVISRPNHEVPLAVSDELQVSSERPFVRDAVVSVVPVEGDPRALHTLNYLWSPEGSEQALAFEDQVVRRVDERLGDGSWMYVSEHADVVADVVRECLSEAGLSDMFDVTVHVPERLRERERDEALREFFTESSEPSREGVGLAYQA